MTVLDIDRKAVVHFDDKEGGTSFVLETLVHLVDQFLELFVVHFFRGNRVGQGGFVFDQSLVERIPQVIKLHEVRFFFSLFDDIEKLWDADRC